MIKICSSFELAHLSKSRFCPTLNIGLYNGEGLFLIGQDLVVDDHDRACTDDRILFTDGAGVVSAERSTVIKPVHAARIPGGHLFGGAAVLDFEAGLQSPAAIA